MYETQLIERAALENKKWSQPFVNEPFDEVFILLSTNSSCASIQKSYFVYDVVEKSDPIVLQ